MSIHTDRSTLKRQYFREKQEDIRSNKSIIRLSNPLIGSIRGLKNRPIEIQIDQKLINCKTDSQTNKQKYRQTFRLLYGTLLSSINRQTDKQTDRQT